MPNIIVLDQDNRTANQITSCFNSMKDVKFRRFTSIEEFSSTYFNESHLDSARGHLDDIESFRKVEPKAKGWILSNNFADHGVIPGEQIKVKSMFPVHFIESWSPAVEDPATILGFSADELAKSKNIFIEKIAPPFKKEFEEYVKSCSLGAQKTRLFCFTTKAKTYCALEVSGAPGSNKTVELEINDINSSFAEALTKEKARIAGLKQEANDLKLLKKIDLIVLRYDLIKDKPREKLRDIHAKLKSFGFTPEKFRTRVIIVKYEDDGAAKTDFAVPEVDGLVFYPIDKSIFLQTIEILERLPEKDEPSYLFNQNVEIEIDICKTAILHSFNEFCIAVVNPVSLVSGLLGHFYIRVKNNEIRISGKVFRCIANPDNPNQYLVFFAYFALPPKSLIEIKKHIAEQRGFEMLKSNTRNEFKFDSTSSNYSLNDLLLKQVVVVLPGEEEKAKIKGILEDDFERISVTPVNTFHELITKYLPAKAGGSHAVHPASGDDFPFNDLWFVYDKTTHQIEEADERFAEDAEATFLGHSCRDLFAVRKDRWKRLLGDSEMLLLKEVTRVIDNARQKHVVELKHIESGSRIVSLQFNLERGSKNNIRIEIRIPKANEVKDYLAPPAAISRIDAMFVDTRLLHGGASEWITELDEILKGRGLENEEPLLMLHCPQLSKEKIEDFQSKRVVSLFHSATDMRHIQFSISQFLQNRFNMHCFDNLNFLEPNQKIHVAKPVKLEKVSEYGATILHPKPFNYGSFLFLRGDIYKDAPESNLLARFYHNEPSEEHSGKFSCSLVYFGLNESFLKSLRKWFMELHVEANKDQN